MNNYSRPVLYVVLLALIVSTSGCASSLHGPVPDSPVPDSKNCKFIKNTDYSYYLMDKHTKQYIGRVDVSDGVYTAYSSASHPRLNKDFATLEAAQKAVLGASGCMWD